MFDTTITARNGAVYIPFYSVTATDGTECYFAFSRQADYGQSGFVALLDSEGGSAHRVEFIIPGTRKPVRFNAWERLGTRGARAPWFTPRAHYADGAARGELVDFYGGSKAAKRFAETVQAKFAELQERRPELFAPASDAELLQRAAEGLHAMTRPDITFTMAFNDCVKAGMTKADAIKFATESLKAHLERL